MKKIKVKYCGLKTRADVDAAIQAEVDAIGLVFVEQSPRYISPADAVELAAVAKQAGILVVALFADHDAAYVHHVIGLVKPDVLQFHGTESAAYCEQFNGRYWKAVPMLKTQDYQLYMQQYSQADAFLLDAFGGQQTGGSGQTFQWFKFPEALTSKLILAGGLNAENVSAAIAATDAQFIDTSSGIESSAGVKSRTKMLALMEVIQAIENNTHKQ